MVSEVLADCDSNVAEMVMGVVVTLLALTTPLTVTDAVWLDEELHVATLLTS